MKSHYATYSAGQIRLGEKSGLNLHLVYLFIVALLYLITFFNYDVNIFLHFSLFHTVNSLLLNGTVSLAHFNEAVRATGTTSRV